ncbi:50S ribosomal protein L23 [Candidatus Uhrbacteria bacterium]|nr:50S ribosomal protein L23 [Candidatus Uhrbacteria bacterium]
MGFFDKFSKKKGSGDAKPSKAAKAAKASDTKTADAKTADTKESKKAVVKGPLAKEGAGSAYRVLVRPIFTEKASALQAMGKYAFEVATNANKMEVSRAIADLYGVKPVSVRIIKVQGKEVRFGRTLGRERDIKKAIVSLKPGESITVVEGVA